jgi:N-acetylglutamate synthase-like GNAT family acetyltransferase
MQKAKCIMRICMIMENLQIVNYSDELAHHFHDLNKAWLEKYFVVEPIDKEMLSNPRKFFIDKGGYIFFVKIGDEVAGTFALIKESDTVYELSKMAVDEKFQGKKIGNYMLEFCLNKAKDLGAEKVFLFSNTILGPAIHLYRKYGFVEIPVGSSEYKRSNIKMERVI